jgi:hypothetical protein
MAAKIQIDDLECEIKNRIWSCKKSPEVAVALQQLTDDFLEQSGNYHPDKDEAAAIHAARLTGGNVISVDAPEELPAEVVA